MKSEKFFKTAFSLAAFFILGGCMTNLSPQEVSERFWSAVRDRDVAAARQYVSSRDQLPEDLAEDVLPINEFTLGRIVIDGDRAWVDTRVVIAGEKPFTMPLKTVLLQVNGQWKVDYESTVAPVSRDSELARVVGSLANLSKQFTDELDRSLDEIQRALPEIQREIGKIEGELREKLPELRQRVDEFLRQLEEALGDKSGKRPPEGTTEI